MAYGSAPHVALLAHGKNWEVPVPEDPALIRPSFDTTLTAEAAGILFTGGDSVLSFDRLILSTGYTAGSRYPSEAQAMRQVLRERFDPSEIPDEAILMEEQSFDTSGNLMRVNELCAEHDIGAIALLTVGYHLPRTWKLANKLLDVPIVASYKSDEVVRRDRGESGHFYTRSVARQAVAAHSARPLVRLATSLVLEGGAWILAVADPTGEGISSKITTKIRHQEEN